MKRKVTATILTAFMTLGVATPVFAAEVANPTSSAIYVDGEKVDFEAYNINGNNYFKLRDVAWALSGTDAQFNVTWNDAEGVINLIDGEDYGKNGALSVGNGKVKSATLNTAPIMKDGSYVNMTAYNIEGNNFFKLRDLGEQFDFVVGWDGSANAVTIDTDGIVEEIEEKELENVRDASEYDPVSGLLKSGLEDRTLVNTGMTDTRGYEYGSDSINLNFPPNGTSWIEGEKHGMPKAGDTVIDAETGKKVVLQWSIIGNMKILGYGSGVDFVTGTTINGHTRTEDKLGGPWKGYGDLSAWVKDPQSGEVHTENEWTSIMTTNYPPEHGIKDGTKDGETVGLADGKLQGEYYAWDGLRGTWYWIGPGDK